MKIRFFYFLLLLGALSCTKRIEIPNTNYAFLSEDELLQSDGIRKSLVDRIYLLFANIFNTNSSSNLSLQMGLYADEFYLYVPNISTLGSYNNEFQLNNTGYYTSVTDFFSSFFYVINQANIYIDIYNKISVQDRTLNDQQMLGEVYLLRAMSYNFLKLLYGGVPLFYNSVDFNANFSSARSSIKEIDEFILESVRNSLNYLSENKIRFDFSISNNVSYRLNKDAAYMFLSDFFLEKGELDSSILYSKRVLDRYPIEYNLSETFTVNSSETIWVLQNFSTIISVASANIFNLETQNLTSVSPVGLSSFFHESVMDSDKRLGVWYRYRTINQQNILYSKKYTTLTAILNNIDPYIMYRSSKAVYNLAEAYYKIGDMGSSYYYFNQLWSKNHDEDLNENDYSFSLLMNDRFVEFATESGDRWFSLLRNNLLDNYMPIVVQDKSDGLFQWSGYKKHWPLGENIIRYSTTVSQTPGYFNPLIP